MSEMREQDIYQGPIFSLVRKQMDVNGRLRWRDLIIHPGGAAISVIAEGRILLVSQTRAGIGNIRTLEIPAGTIDPGEDPMTTAMRELNEETGCTASSLSLITAFWPTPGYDSEVIYVYEAHQVRKAETRLAMDPGEDIVLQWMDLEEAYQKIQDGSIRDGKTILAIYHALLSGQSRPSSADDGEISAD